MERELIQIASEKCFSPLDHSSFVTSLRDASLRGSGGEGGTVGLREGSVKEFWDSSVWTEESSSPNWALKRFEVFLWFLDWLSSNREGNFGGRISSSSDVPGSGEGSRVESKFVEDEGWVQLLEDPHGSTHTPLGEDPTRLTRRYPRQYNQGFY